jgi:hypothetical protein
MASVSWQRTYAVKTHVFVAISVCPLLVSALFIVGVNAGTPPCPSRSTIAAVVEAHLPAFTLPGPGLAALDACSQVASGDFNGDAVPDLAAVLTEKTAPRKYSDGTDQFSSYVFIFLGTHLPYADYEAVLLLGHTSAPRRITLQTLGHTGNDVRDRLIVTNASYSRTVYEWRATGFVVLKHDAD